VKTLKGKPVEKPLTFTQLRDAHDADPNHLDLAARLAEQYLVRRRNTDARKLADAVLAKRRTHPLAGYVKARLLLAAGDDEAALKALEVALDPKSPEPKVALALGKLYFDAKDFPRAAQTLELGRRAEPYESKWLEELARVYGQSGDKDKQIASLKELVATDADELDLRKRLARMLLADRPAEAEKYAREALEIDVVDAEVQDVLLKALAAQNKEAEAERMRKILER
jgi:predicted Zn-dependent protease